MLGDWTDLRVVSVNETSFETFQIKDLFLDTLHHEKDLCKLSWIYI